QFGVQRRAFGHIAECAPGGARRLGDVVSGDANAATGGPQKTGQDAQRGALAGAVWAEKTDDFAFPDRKRQVTHRDHGAVVFGEVRGFDHALAGASSVSSSSTAPSSSRIAPW